MSMAEASRAWPADIMAGGEDESALVKLITSLDQAEHLVSLAKTQGAIDRASSTWSAVCRWAALRIIELRAGRGSEVRDAKIEVLLELLEFPENIIPAPIKDAGPDIP